MVYKNRSHQPVSKLVAALPRGGTLRVACALMFVTLCEPLSASSESPIVAEGNVTQNDKTSSPTEAKTDQPPANQNATGQDESKAKKKEVTRVFVGGPDRKPVDKAEIYWLRSRVHDLRPMKPQLVATTDAEGKAVFEAPWKTPADKNQPASWEYWDRILVKAKGFGWEYTSPESMSRPANGPGAFLFSIIGSAGNAIGLPEAGPPIRGQIFDIEGQPVPGATIRVRWFDANGIEDVTNTRFFERARGVRDVIEPEQLRHILSSAITDSNGRFELVDLLKNCLVDLLVQGDTIESTGLIAFNGSESDIDVPQGARRDQREFKVHGRNLRMVVGPSKPLEGQVVDLDTGSPIEDAVVRAFAIHGINLYSSREREQFSTRTDASGRYRITGLPIGDGNRLAAFTTGDVPYIPIGHGVDTNNPDPVIRQEFRVKKGVWAEGRVCDDETKEPFTGEIVYYSFINQEIEKSIPGFRDAYVDGRYSTNANGEFRVPVAPTRGILAFRYHGHNQGADPMTRYPRGYGAESISGADKKDTLGSYPTIPFYLIPSNYQRLAEVDPKEGDKTVQVDMSLRASKPVSITVVDHAGKSIVGYEVYGAAENWGWQKKDASKFDVGDLKPGEQRKIFVFHRQRNLAGAAIVATPTEDVVKIQLDKAGSISGLVIDEDGEPIKGATINIDYEGLLQRKDTAIWANGPKLIYNPTIIPTDLDGRFTVDGLIPGWKYTAYVSAKRNVGGTMQDQFVGNPFKDATIEPGENKNLGTIKLVPQNDSRERLGCVE